MGALSRIFEITFPSSVEANTTVKGKITWGNGGDKAALMKLFIENGQELRRRTFEPNHAEIVDISFRIGDTPIEITYIAQHSDDGGNLWGTGDKVKIVIGITGGGNGGNGNGGTTSPTVEPSILDKIKARPLETLLVVGSIGTVGYYYKEKKKK